jgi:4'-phosphopantetheinyl transferase
MDYLCYKFSELAPESIHSEYLTAEERQTYAKRGTQAMTARSLLRLELARRLNCEPHEIEFEVNKHGKPHLVGNELHFNISHSADLLCMAFHHEPIGVDVQQLRPAAATLRLAERIMCAEQLSNWCQRGQSVDEFFACWCAAEALVKHAGSTVWQAREFPFLCHHGRIEPLFSPAPRVQLFTPMPGYSGAICL